MAAIKVTVYNTCGKALLYHIVQYIILAVTYILCVLWKYGLWSFQTGGTKLERFLPKNQHTQRKLSNFENWVSGEVSKSAKSQPLDFQS